MNSILTKISDIKLNPNNKVIKSNVVVNFLLFILMAFNAKWKVTLLNKIAIVLKVNALGNWKSFNQSGLVLLTTKPLDNPAKIIKILTIPKNNNIL